MTEEEIQIQRIRIAKAKAAAATSSSRGEGSFASSALAAARGIIPGFSGVGAIAQKPERLGALAEGLTLGAAGEVGAAPVALAQSLSGHGSFSENFNRLNRNFDKRMETYRQGSPGEALAIELLGGIPSGAGIAKGMGSVVKSIPKIGALAQSADKLSRGQQLAKATAIGAGSGGAYGFNTGQGGIRERAENAKKGATLGALFGGGLNIVSQSAGRISQGLGKMSDDIRLKYLGAKPKDIAKNLRTTGTRSALKKGATLDEVRASVGDVIDDVKEKYQVIKNDGFFDSVGNNPKSAFKEIEARLIFHGQELGNKVVNKVSRIKAVEQPDFTQAKKEIEKIGAAVDTSGITKRLNHLIGQWEKSGKTVGDLIRIKQGIGEIQGLFSKLGSLEENLPKNVFRKAYGAFKQAAEKNIDGLEAEGLLPKGVYRDLNRKLESYFSFRDTIPSSVGNYATSNFWRELFRSPFVGSGGIIASGYGLGTGNVPLAAAAGGVVGGRAAAARLPVSTASLLDKTSRPLSALGGLPGGVTGGVLAGQQVRQNLTPEQTQEANKNGLLPQALESLRRANELKKKEQKMIKEPDPDQVSSKPYSYEPLVDAVIKVESNGKPDAISHAGAMGLMQLMPKTAEAIHKRLGLPGEANPMDPELNVMYGRELLFNELLPRFKSLDLALAAYNTGPSNVDKAIRKAGSRDFADIKKYLPKETQAYVPKVISKLTQEDSNSIYALVDLEYGERAA